MELKYFAWIAEIIDKREESLEIPSEIETIGQLIDYLSSIDEAYKKAFEKRKSINLALFAIKMKYFNNVTLATYYYIIIPYVIYINK